MNFGCTPDVNNTIFNISTRVNGIILNNGCLHFSNDCIIILFDTHKLIYLLADLTSIHVYSNILLINTISFQSIKTMKNITITTDNDITTFTDHLIDKNLLVDCNLYNRLDVIVHHETTFIFFDNYNFIAPFLDTFFMCCCSDKDVIFEDLEVTPITTRFCFIEQTKRVSPFFYCKNNKDAISSLCESCGCRIYNTLRLGDLDKLLYLLRSSNKTIQTVFF
ncbi:Uncharacterized protein QTN25_005236 [Entamoeba marina]